MDASRRQRILVLALPILGGMVSQNLLNVVDTAMVGFLGNPALAAVGLGGFVVFMCQALILGISTGVQTLAARKRVRAASIAQPGSSTRRCCWFSWWHQYSHSYLSSSRSPYILS